MLRRDAPANNRRRHTGAYPWLAAGGCRARRAGRRLGWCPHSAWC